MKSKMLLIVLILGWPWDVCLVLADDADQAFHRGAANAPPIGTAFLYPERVFLESGEAVEFERGLLFVPMNRRDANSEAISIEIVRFRAEHSRPTQAPVFKLYGGPGFPGISAPDTGFLTADVWPVTRELGADFVVVGQRGIGSSKPSTLVEPIEGFRPDKAQTEEQYRDAVRKACQQGKRYWQSRGLDVNGFNVIEAAADVNDARAALGYKSVILSGSSFGSHWGMAVMRYHPEIVERAILSGLEGPDHTWDMPSHVFNTLERIAKAAEQDPALALHIPEMGLIAALREVTERLDATPATVQVEDHDSGSMTTVLVDGRAIRDQLLSGMSNGYGIRSWPAKVIDLNSGNYEAAARLRLKSSAPLRGATLSFFLLDCSSGISSVRRRQVEQDPAVSLLGKINDAYRVALPVMNVDVGEEFRRGFTSEIPTLLVQGTWDVNTPLENANEIAKFFPRAKLVFVERGSHVALREALGTSEAFRNAYVDFLRTGNTKSVPDTVTLPAVQWTVPSSKPEISTGDVSSVE